MVAGRFTKLASDQKYSRDVAWAVGIVRMAGNADKTVFGERARRPRRADHFQRTTDGPARGGYASDRSTQEAS